MNHFLPGLALITFVINIPLGYWREGVRKFSARWFIAVHAAVPLVIALRILAGIEWRILTIGFLVLCYFFGQFTGARLRRRRQRSPLTEPVAEP